MDVGANHGYLSLALSSLGIKTYAVENKQGPFQTLVKSVKENGGKVECIYADGLDQMPSDVDGVFVLGMGAQTMEDILFRYPEKLSKLQHLVLEPQTDPSSLFRRLYDFGFQDEKGCYVFERHYYPLLSFVKGKVSHDMVEDAYGRYPLYHKDLTLFEKLSKELSVLCELQKQGVKDKEKEISIHEEALRRWNLGN